MDIVFYAGVISSYIGCFLAPIDVLIQDLCLSGLPEIRAFQT